MNGLLPNYDRDARLAPTFTCAGLGGCCSGGSAGEIKKRLDRTRSDSRWKLGLITGCEGGMPSMITTNKWETVFSRGGAGYGRVCLQRPVLASQVSRWRLGGTESPRRQTRKGFGDSFSFIREPKMSQINGKREPAISARTVSECRVWRRSSADRGSTLLSSG